jgi:glycerate kinase
VARIVIAPDSFKGTASAEVAAAAIARGWSSVRPNDELVLLPLADGGEGTLEAFAAAVPGAQWMSHTVKGPDGRPVDAEWLLLPDGTGVVELARTSGLTLLDPLLPFDADTVGFGELIAAAMHGGAARLILAIGGSSSTDGGAGALTALGVKLLTASKEPIALGNRGLPELHSVDWSDVLRPPGSVVVLCDVTNPLLGPSGAAAVFGPQKGATIADIPALEAGLAHFATVLGGDPDFPGAGAAGGTSFGLVAWGAELRSGAAEIAVRTRLAAAVSSAHLVITGEGRFDHQSAGGKIPHYVAEFAAGAGVDAALIAGVIDAPTGQFAHALSLVELAGTPELARADAAHWLERAGADLATRFG